LEGANKIYGTSLMISEFTHTQLTANLFRTRILDLVKVKGKTQAIKVYEVYGETAAPVDRQNLSYYQTYEEAFQLYLSRRFIEAREKIVAALALRHDDTASKMMLARLDSLNPASLPDDWDGAMALTSK
jgi:adenylate cyclase